jgi:predicted HD phosphohydrolase
MPAPFATLDALFAAFDQYGGERYGEEVSQLSHMLQSAALAQADHAPDALIAAALLHDVGYLQAGREAAGPHEQIGADSLSALFGPEVCRPIALHVAAKRYLCAVRPGYLACLSKASQDSLIRQGGPFSSVEAAAFMADPEGEAAMRLRLYDDQAKDPAANPPGLATYHSLLQRLLHPPGGAGN